jgi:hypothetical protein
MRVPVLVLALLAMPIAAGVAQSRGKGKDQRVRAADAQSECKDQQAATLARANADGHDPYGLDKKCGDPVPAPVPPPPTDVPPPTGVNRAVGVVYEDIAEMDGIGNGRFDPMAGEMGLAGWTVQLYWNGRVVAEAVSDANGAFVFPNLGNAATGWAVCVVEQAGFVRTQPVPPVGNACNGAGYAFALTSTFPTDANNPFGMQMVIP